MLVERGRLLFSVPLLECLEAAAHRRSVRLVPISPVIAAEIAALPKSFHRDPADRLIVATCRALNAPILTIDRADSSRSTGQILQASRTNAQIVRFLQKSAALR